MTSRRSTAPADRNVSRSVVIVGGHSEMKGMVSQITGAASDVDGPGPRTRTCSAESGTARVRSRAAGRLKAGSQSWEPCGVESREPCPCVCPSPPMTKPVPFRGISRADALARTRRKSTLRLLDEYVSGGRHRSATSPICSTAGGMQGDGKARKGKAT